MKSESGRNSNMTTTLQQLRIRADDLNKEIFSDQQLEEFIDMAVRERGGYPTELVDNAAVLNVAFILLLSTQALKECGKEFVVADNSVEVHPAPVTNTILELIRLELERLKLIVG